MSEIVVVSEKVAGSALLIKLLQILFPHCPVRAVRPIGRRPFWPAIEPRSGTDSIELALLRLSVLDVN